MNDQLSIDRSTVEWQSISGSKRKGKQKEWKDLTRDPLSEGFDSHQAEYIVGKSPVGWLTVSPGQLFARSKSGRSLYVKMNDGRAICLDTKEPIEVKPSIRQQFQVWLVTSFNSTNANETKF